MPATDRLYPVHRVFCVGRNYEAHAAEMGHKVDRETPFYFLKGHHAVTASGATVAYPPGTTDYHFEMELVLALNAPAFQADAGYRGSGDLGLWLPAST